MKPLLQRLLEKLIDTKQVVEPIDPKPKSQTGAKLLAVVYGGRFQPFHRGHFAAYKQLCKWFDKDDVWITSSNKVDPDGESPSYLTFDERKELIIQLYGVDENHIIKAKNPAFSPIEVLKLYKGPTVCVLACGKKDAERYRESKLFKPYPMKTGEPVSFEQVKQELQPVNGDSPTYYYVVTTAEAPNEHMSGTKARKLLDEGGTEGFKRVFGKTNKLMQDMIQAKLDQVKKPAEEKSEKPAEKKPEDKPEKPAEDKASKKPVDDKREPLKKQEELK